MMGWNKMVRWDWCGIEVGEVYRLRFLSYFCYVFKYSLVLCLFDLRLLSALVPVAQYGLCTVQFVYPFVRHFHGPRCLPFQRLRKSVLQ